MSGRVGPAAGWVAGAGVVVLAFAAIGILGGGLAAAPSGPTGSSLATSPGGLAAYAELLTRAGHRVDPLRVPLGQARLPAGATLIVADAGGLSVASAQRLRRFVSGGGRLLLAGGPLGRNGPLITAGVPRWGPEGSTGVQTATAAPAARRSLGVRQILVTQPGGWSDAGAAGPITRPGGAAVLVSRRLGDGQVLLLADASPLENRLLGQADDAQLGLALAGPGHRPVVFAEALHGNLAATGLAALPGRWWATLAGLGLAGLLWAVSRGRRLGPVQAPGPAAPPARVEYVGALATLLVRSGDADQLTRLADDHDLAGASR